MKLCNAPFCDQPQYSNHAWCVYHRSERRRFNVTPFKQIKLFKTKKIIKKPSKEKTKLYNANREKYRRDHQYLKRYGVTYAFYLNLLDLYNHECGICKSKPTKHHPLHLDHCHITKKVRGILCYKCNVALGYFQDSIPNLVAATNYLRRHF